MDAPPVAIVANPGPTNRAFLDTHAGPGRVGLAGGETLIELAIRRSQRRIDPEKAWSLWSHAFVFEGSRADGRHWCLESDLEIARKHVRLGVQENRVDKYYDQSIYTKLAVLDFGLSADQTSRLLSEGLDLVASHARYSIRELFGTLITLHRSRREDHGNPLARDGALYCSAFVRHLFLKIGIDLAPDLHHKNTTPEDIARTAVPHATYLLERPAVETKLTKAAARLKLLPRERRSRE
ncbi:MAG: hypothetical protein U0166_19950 [Acidobacteriota bacterium]